MSALVSSLKRHAHSARDWLSVGVARARELRVLRCTQLAARARFRGSDGRLAIVGCGVMGRHLAKAVRLLPGWQVSGLCDRRPDATAALRAQAAPDALVTADLEALLARTDAFDVLAVATTAPSHVPIALAAIRAGVKAILVEKPVANSLEAAEELDEAARQAGCRIAVDHTRRWIAAGDGIRRLIQSGVIGRPVALHAIPGRGGVAMIGTHSFDFARWVLGDDFQRVRADLDEVVRTSHRGAEFMDRSGRCEAYLKSGIRLTLDLSDTLGSRQGYVLVVGDAGRIEIDEQLGRVRLLGAGRRVWDYEYVWPEAQAHGVAAALLELVAGGSIQCAVADGLASLEMAVACTVSHREQGRWVELPLVGPVRQETFPFA